MASRDAELNVIGHDKTGAATRSAARNFDRLGRKLNDVDKRNSRVGRSFDKLGVRLSKIAQTGLRFGSRLAAGMAVAATSAVSLTKAITPLAVQGPKLIAWAGTMTAALGPLALAFGLISKTLSAGFEPSLKRLGEHFTKLATEAHKAAFQGVKPLADAFSKANLPQLRGTMESINRSAADVVKHFLRWGTTKAGIRTIGVLTDNIADFADRLKGPLQQVVQSFLTMSSRISGVALRKFGEAAEWAGDKLASLMDRVSAADVKKAFDDAARAFDKLAAAGRGLGDALEWIEQHQATIDRVRNALAAFAIVAGIASGTWLPALAGAATLLITHWDKIKGVFDRVKGAFQSFATKYAPQLKAGVDAVQSGFRAFVNYVGPIVAPLLGELKELWRQLEPAVAALAPILGIALGAFIRIAAFWTGNAILAIRALVKAFTGLIQISKALAIAILWLAKQFIRGISNMLNAAADAAEALGLKKVAQKLRETAGKVERQADRIQTAIDALHGKTVTVRVITAFSSIGKRARAGGSDEVIRLSGAAGGFEFAVLGGGGRTGGPSPVVNVAAPIVSVNNTIDGRQFDARMRAVVVDENRRSAHRARVGRR